MTNKAYLPKINFLYLFSFLFLGILNFNSLHAQVELRGLVLLIDFADDPEIITSNRVDSLINGITYTEPVVPSSIRNYWMVQSRDSVSLTHQIFGYYRAPETAAWYAEQEWTIVYDLLTDALDSAVAQNPDYDWDELSLSSRPGYEGTFLSVSIVTTAWVAGSGGAHGLPGGTWTAPNGVEVRAFTSQPLTSQWDPTFIRLFVIAHEIGHAAWGFPDTYDTDATSFGTGIYSVMSGNQIGGEVEPIGGPFFIKNGWVNVFDILPNTSYTLPQDGKAVARYVNPSNPNEYFVIEACMNATLGNAAFPVERGLVIWHVDEGVVTGNTQEEMTFDAHYAFSIEQADGQFDLENLVNQGDAGDIFVEGSVFNELSFPNSTWWNGENSGIDIHSIQFLADNKIKFCNGDCELSVDELAFEELVQIYAAISTPDIWIKTANIPADYYTIDVMNFLGQVIYSNTIFISENSTNNQFNFKLGDQANGVYIVQINGTKTPLKKVEKIVLN